MGGAQAAVTAPARAVEQWVLGRGAVLAGCGLGGLWYGAAERQRRVRDVSYETTCTRYGELRPKVTRFMLPCVQSVMDRVWRVTIGQRGA